MSGPSCTLYTKEKLGEEAFAEFIATVGGVMDGPRQDEARISEGSDHVWISLESDATIDRHCDLASDNGKGLMAKLGEQPRSYVHLDLSKRYGADTLALKFAVAFLKRWNGILVGDRDDGPVYDLQQLRRLQREGEGLGLYD